MALSRCPYLGAAFSGFGARDMFAMTRWSAAALLGLLASATVCLAQPGGWGGPPGGWGGDRGSRGGPPSWGGGYPGGGYPGSWGGPPGGGPPGGGFNPTDMIRRADTNNNNT